MTPVIQIYTTYIKALHDAFSDVVSPALQNLEDTFAPVSPPESDEWLGILLSVIGLVGTIGGSAFFNSCMCYLPFPSLFHKSSSTFPRCVNYLVACLHIFKDLSAMPYFKANKALYDNLKDTTKAIVSFGTSLTSTLYKPGSVSA